ncbi:HAD family phosphatase [Asticcacaulis sp. BYS171W]|uniref:HAD family phosphatase n=1 Tax=Asticcacaulis aquaticus TaxID=2984212 RepID=A0ABT5HWB4_9CAUL|nr:HAD family phosphatase [Asticcacaulis aquaticus]MDC7684359.1 HAD family phosphatase [Asticcacaulis aquaticus]
MSVPADLLPPPGVKALIFDCDGTLADTFAAHYRALSVALEVYNINLEPQFYADRLGLSRSVLLEEYARQSPLPFDADDIAARNAPLFMDHIDRVAAIPVTEALVREYHGQLKLGVASGGQKLIVKATLKAIGLIDYFETVTTFEDTGVGKPAPDLYLTACDRLGVAPSEAHAYEDSDEGMEAARAAGMTVSDIRPFYTTDPALW